MGEFGDATTATEDGPLKATRPATKYAPPESVWAFVYQVGPHRVAIIALVFLLILAVGVWAFLRFVLPDDDQLRVNFTDQGTTVLLARGEPAKAFLLVSASNVWQNTGLRIKPGEVLSVTASGEVNLGIHLLVHAADSAVRPRHQWTGPNGAQERDERGVDIDKGNAPNRSASRLWSIFIRSNSN